MQLFNILAKCTKDNYACIGVIGEKGFPGDLVSIIHYLYLAIQVVVPIILIIFGMIELGKALTSQKEDEIKRAQSSFLHKLIIAALVFIVFSVVRLVFNFANSGNPDSENVWNCVNQVINGNCGQGKATSNDKKNNTNNQTDNKFVNDVYSNRRNRNDN